MNGQELSYIKELFDERHEENKEKFSALFNKVEDIHKCIKDFPCKAHTADLRWLKGGFRFVGAVVIVILATYLRMNNS